MYVKPPKQSISRVKIPENYSGNAFDQSGMYNDMPPPARQSSSIPRTPISSDLPPSSRLGGKGSSFVHDADILQAAYSSDGVSSEPEADTDRYSDSGDRLIPTSAENAQSTKSSIFSSLLPLSSQADHFPFGHGIGGEELLILGTMLLIYLSGNESGHVDNEFILLLGLLLFAG